MAIEYDYDDVAEFLLSKARRELALTAWLPEGKTTWGGRTTLRAGGAFIFTRARHLTPRFASLRLLFLPLQGADREIKNEAGHKAIFGINGEKDPNGPKVQ